MDLSTITALILAGGLGTRLRPVVPDTPKALAPLGGRPFLEYQIEWLARQGIRRIVLCVGYRSQEIMQYFGDGGRWGVQIDYSVEETLLGTGGALRLAQPLLRGAFVALNGDTYYLDPLAPFLEQHRRTGALLTIAVSAQGAGEALGQIAVGDDHRILHFAEKTKPLAGGWSSAGLYMAEPPLLDMIAPGLVVSLEREVFPALIAAKAPVYAYPLSQGYLDMGTPEGYTQLMRQLAADSGQAANAGLAEKRR
jgi:NDP-sugar pyrophosphorylase family protein